MIANILDGKPADGGTNNTTLIVCPASLCIQWFKEIERHTEKDALGEIMIYRGASRTYYSDPMKALSKFNVIITSYTEVTKSYPQLPQPLQYVTGQHQRDWWEKQYREQQGVLHRINFRRVVLDEAQMIKNHTSKVSLACRALHSKYRWALTGTPIQNKVEEFFPYLSFLKVEHTGSYATFKTNYCKKGSKVALDRLHAILDKIMIRRTHSDEMFGVPLAKLPNLTTKTVTVEFNATERAIYKIVRTRFIAQIKIFAKAGPLNKSYRGILVLYLRLRQLVGHFLLIQKTIMELLEAEDLEKLWRLTEKEVQRNSGSRDAQFEGSEPCQGFEQATFSSDSAVSNRPSRGNRGAPQSADEDVDWLNLTSFCLPWGQRGGQDLGHSNCVPLCRVRGRRRSPGSSGLASRGCHRRWCL